MPNPLVLLYGPERDSTQIRFDLKGSRHSVLREHEGINLPPPLLLSYTPPSCNVTLSMYALLFSQLRTGARTIRQPSI